MNFTGYKQDNINIGDLNRKVDVLTLENADGAYSWNVSTTIWANVEELDKTNIFSKVGIGVKSTRFIIRKRALTLHQALKWQGRHYFLSDIREINRMFYEVTAAQIDPKECIVTRNVISKNELNRPTHTSQVITAFPGYLVEKYLDYRQEKPQAVNEITYVLITPKEIELQVADLVKIGDSTYNIQIAHTLDEYKNEYEINLIKDV